MLDLIGKTINRYHVIKKLGEGGMAIVYKAYDTVSHKEVALKIIRSEKAASELFVKRFLREIKALTLLDHSNIIPVIDSGNFDGTPYLVMPFMPGGTLKQKLGKPINYAQSARFLLPIADALSYAHKLGVVHRDIKPSNILLTSKNEPMLSDFGIAKLLGENETTELTRTGMGVGTPEYMAPEQLMGKVVDGRADEYSLGIVFYEMITGYKPYQSDTPYALAWKQMNEPLPKVTNSVKGIPDVVEETILKVLSKDPVDRFSSMNNFQSALNIFASEDLDKMKAMPIEKESGKGIQRQEDISQNAAGSIPTITEPRLVVPQSKTNTAPMIKQEGRLNLKKWLLALSFFLALGIALIIFNSLLQGSQANSQKSEMFQQNTTTEVSTLADVQGAFFVGGAIEQTESKELVPSLSPDVIQLTNYSSLTEINRWKGTGIWISAWLDDSSGFLTESYGSSYTYYSLESLSPTVFNDEISYVYLRAFSHGADLYATTDQGSKLQLWKRDETQPYCTIFGNDVSTTTPPAFSLDEQMVAALIDKKMRFYSTSNGEELFTLDSEPADFFQGVDTRYISVFSPSGKYFASGNSSSGEILIWNLQTRAVTQAIHWHEGVWALEFSPDSETLVSGSNSYNGRDNIRFWRVIDGQLIRKIEKSNNQIYSLTYSLDGRLLATGSNTSVRIWRVEDGALLATLDDQDMIINTVAFSPNGKYLLASGSDIVVWGIYGN